MNWINVEDELPEYEQNVLVLIESEPYELDDGTVLGEKYWYTIGRLHCQFRTDKPFWVSAWDFDPIESSDTIATYWMSLPGPPNVENG